MDLELVYYGVATLHEAIGRPLTASAATTAPVAAEVCSLLRVTPACQKCLPVRRRRRRYTFPRLRGSHCPPLAMNTSRRSCETLSVAAVLLLLALLASPAHAAPYRTKRVSDQRLAEIETLLALNKLKGRLVTVPVGFGKVDPARLGRRRRSEELLGPDSAELSDEELSDLLGSLRHPAQTSWLSDWGRGLQVQ